jgi:hypothetical protein
MKTADGHTPTGANTPAASRGEEFTCAPRRQLPLKEGLRNSEPQPQTPLLAATTRRRQPNKHTYQRAVHKHTYPINNHSLLLWSTPKLPTTATDIHSQPQRGAIPSIPNPNPKALSRPGPRSNCVRDMACYMTTIRLETIHPTPNRNKSSRLADVNFLLSRSPFLWPRQPPTPVRFDARFKLSPSRRTRSKKPDPKLDPKSLDAMTGSKTRSEPHSLPFTTTDRPKLGHIFLLRSPPTAFSSVSTNPPTRRNERTNQRTNDHRAHLFSFPHSLPCKHYCTYPPPPPCPGTGPYSLCLFSGLSSDALPATCMPCMRAFSAIPRMACAWACACAACAACAPATCCGVI